MTEEPTSNASSAKRFSESAAALLATEHWSLLGTRSMAWNEAFSRTSVFLNTLSASVVALALVADATGFRASFATFASVLFPIVLFLGVTTYLRLVKINIDDVAIVAAMNRLRRAYLDMAPELAPYFSTGTHDDVRGIWKTNMLDRSAPSRLWPEFLVTTPTVVATIDSIVAAAGCSFAAARLDASGAVVVAVGTVAFLAVWVGLFSIQARASRDLVRRHEARFPSPDDGASPSVPNGG